jgi:A/G-specific adenine glycosylase
LAYPWRFRVDPYRVLVSEVMLQQTQASRVVPAYLRFLGAFPTVHALAASPRSAVVRAWAGLGYNRRAVALSEAARMIVRDFDGRVPRQPELLAQLPGVGPYTAAAVASLAYGVPVAAVDTNLRRVLSRALLGVEADEISPATISKVAARWMDGQRPGAWNQALMDLGREVCRPLPRCGICPLRSLCLLRRSGTPTASALRRVSRQSVQAPFEGSFRQVRGRVVAALRDRPSASLSSLARATGEPLARVAEAVAALSREGLVRAGPAALAGRAAGRARLA